MSVSEISGQGAKQFIELGCAFVLSAAVGMEREFRHKSAGLRTYTVVGTTSALFLLISQYGFTDVLAGGTIVLDPSRVAAQIVTGIGFIGAGLIFVRGDRVQGLTTAATARLVTGIGMACGAGLPWLAFAVTAAYSSSHLSSPYSCAYCPVLPLRRNRTRNPERTSGARINIVPVSA
jgi:putative Mg2+ transporter-C (MgtC) family protein